MVSRVFPGLIIVQETNTKCISGQSALTGPALISGAPVRSTATAWVALDCIAVVLIVTSGPFLSQGGT